MPIRTDLWKVSATPQPMPEAQLVSEKKLEDMIVAAPKLADTDHFETEERSRTYGISNKGRLLVVVHTERRDNVRIISARKATRYEKSIYDKI